jgi:glutathione peroxidase
MSTGKKIYSKLKKVLIVLSILIIALFTYVAIVNKNSINMTYRQKFLKAFYPAMMWFAKLGGANAKVLTNEKAMPAVSFYTLQDTAIDGKPFNFETLKGKKIMLVNTASDCGYTDQYDDLQKLYEANKDKLVIIGFPANDFKQQEKADNTAIAEFCRKNFGVTFPLMQKSSVIKSAEQSKIFKWLTDASLNGWNNEPPSWNFCKYIVDENGRLTHYFGSTISPLSKEITAAVN